MTAVLRNGAAGRGKEGRAVSTVSSTPRTKRPGPWAPGEVT